MSAMLVATPVRAGDSGAALDARAHFQNGIDAVQRGDFARAAQEFEAAQALSPNPVVLYNLGATYSALGLPVQAERALEQFVAQQPQPNDPERRAEAERLLEFNRQRIGAALIDVAPADSALQVDGSPVTLPASGRVRLAAGKHAVVATHPGYKPAIVNVDVVARAEVRLTLALEPDAVAPAPSPRYDQARPPAAVPIHHDASHAPASAATAISTTGVIALAAAGVGGAAMVASFFVGLRVQSLKDDSNRGHCDARGCDPEGLALRGVAVRDGHWATGLFVGGAVVAAAGLTLYFVRGREPAAAPATLSVSPGVGPRSALLRLQLAY